MKKKGQVETIDSRQMESLRVFHEVARALTSNLNPDALLRTIMSKMEEFFGPEHWSLLMVDEENAQLYYELCTGMDKEAMRDLRLPLNQGISGYVATSGNALVVPNVETDPAWSRYAAQHPELNLRSIACLPIRHGNRTLGVLQLNNSKLEGLPESSVSFLRVLCDYAAIALENARQVDMIHRLSITDDCTGLFNARHLYATLETEIAEVTHPRVVPIQQHFSLVFFDLDRFKSVNDTHGHLVGSRLLKEIAIVVKRTLGPKHAAFRYGGDEFVALLRGMDKPAATDLVNHLRECLNEASFLTDDGLSLTVNASFGLATFPQDGATLPSIIRSADTMMYAAKARGRNCVAVADSSAPAEFPAPKISRHS